MDDDEKVEFYIEVDPADLTAEEHDRLTRQLLAELRQMDVESAELLRGGKAPAGTKSEELITTGTIAVAILPTVLAKTVDGIQAWMQRGRNRVVKFRGKVAGQMIEFEGTADDLERIIKALKQPKQTKRKS